jgi:fluoroacetyl-CoA thioesterase
MSVPSPDLPADLLKPGLSHQAAYTVTPEMSPPHLAGILSTSRMIALIEDTCLAAIQPLLGDGQTTVGTRVDAWAGEEITVRIRLEKVTRGRLLSFEVEAAAPRGVISSGTHQRLVIERSQFAARPAAPSPEPTR